MRGSLVAVGVAWLAAGCGQSGTDAKNALNAVQAVTSGQVEEGLKDAEKFHQERVAKGDTLAMPYAELQKFLPTEVAGYQPAEEPSGSSQNMPGFSMSQAKQSWQAAAGGDGSVPQVEITLVDLGGSQQGYAMMAAPMMMGFSQEDANHRAGGIKMDVPHTGGWEEFDKRTKNAKVTAVTRYRYMITVEARDHAEDQSQMVRELAEKISKQFDGK
jgi:hypothetical protein